MKVYAAPEHIKLPNPDYSNYNRDAETKKESEYVAHIKDYMVEQGYTGERTGEIARFPFADGYAQYMFADAGRQSCLIHLALGDAWSYPYIERLTRKDIIDELDRAKKMKKLFGRA